MKFHEMFIIVVCICVSCLYLVTPFYSLFGTMLMGVTWGYVCVYGVLCVRTTYKVLWCVTRVRNVVRLMYEVCGGGYSRTCTCVRDSVFGGE